jgi:chromate transporter
VRFGQLPEVAALLYGIKPAVTAIVLFAAYRIGSRALKNWLLWALAAISFMTIFAFHAPFPMIVLSAALLGAIGGKFVPQYFSVGGGHGNAKQSYGAALIDDNTPIPEHAKFKWSRLVKIIIAGVLLWGGAIGFLCSQYGWNGTLTQMAWFFSKAALLTFGGAYAVLPYVYQGAVEHYHWLNAMQMMDGLALGETTPGPLIMIVTFVGFLGGWNSLPVDSESALMMGIIAATVVTYFTFLPSFLFILVGAPLIESTHGNLKFTAPLSAITAAVVGVILNLAVFFAQHLFLPQGFDGQFDIIAAVISAGALLALVRYKVGIIPVIAVCGAIGVLLFFFKL